MSKTPEDILERLAEIEEEHDRGIVKPPVGVRLGVSDAADRHEGRLDALEAEHTALVGEYGELARKDLTVTPLSGDTMQVAELRRRLKGKKLELGRMRTLVKNSSFAGGLQARIARQRDVEGEIAHLENLIRRLTTPEERN
jgi:hypothetical protein